MIETIKNNVNERVVMERRQGDMYMGHGDKHGGLGDRVEAVQPKSDLVDCIRRSSISGISGQLSKIALPCLLQH